MFQKFACLAVVLSLVGCVPVVVGDEEQAPEPTRGEAIIMGTRHPIQSDALGGERFIRVHLPEGHRADGGGIYPTLYLLDGQRYFAQGVALDRSLKDFDKIPDLIVVGIESPSTPEERTADFLENAMAYHAFLKDELMPFMANHYSAGKISILFGWQYGGRMVINSFVADPTLFDTYVTASTWPVDREIVAKFGETVRSVSAADTKLVLAVAKNEGVVSEGATHFVKTLESQAGDNLAWTFKEYSDEEHTSTGYRTIALGLNKAFADYRWLQFDDVADYKAFGGIDAVREYYRARAEKYGTSPNVVDETIHQIAMIAERADDVDTMEEVLNAFPRFAGRANAYWLSKFGDLYLKQGRMEQAHALLSAAAKRFPDDADIRNGLDKAQVALGRE